MKNQLIRILAAAACASTIASSASAIALSVDGGWQSFSFADGGSVWSDDFTFTLTGPAVFAVTDAYCAGDRFSFSINGGAPLLSSVPFYDGTCISGTTRTTDPDFALASSIWSSGEILLTDPGAYTITGLAVESPFGSGGAFVQLSSTSVGAETLTPAAVPLPAAGWLMVAGLGGLGLMRRKSGRKSA